MQVYVAMSSSFSSSEEVEPMRFTKDSVQYTKCPNCGRVQYKLITEEPSIRIGGQTEYVDFPDQITPWPIVSRKVRDLLVDVRSQSVRVEGVPTGEGPYDYYMLFLEPKVKLDFRKMRVRKLKHCRECGCNAFSKNPWDYGTVRYHTTSKKLPLLFTITDKAHRGLCLCTREFVELANKYNFTNVEFTPLERVYDIFCKYFSAEEILARFEG